MHMPSSKTKIIQVIGRALRLHSLKTIANVILPCSTDDDGKSINNFLKIMARNDTRIKKSFENQTLGGYINIQTNNDDTDDENNEITEVRYEMIYNSMGELKNVKGIWNYKFNILLDFIKEKNRVPKNKERYKSVNINEWFVGQKNKKLFSKKDELYTKSSNNEILKINLNEYLDKKGKDKKIRTFEESFDVLEDFVDEFEKVPTKNDVHKNYNIGQWYSDRKKKIISNKDELYKKLGSNKIVKANLDELIKNKESNKDKESFSFDETFEIFKDYIKKNDKIPIKTEKYKNINIGRWWGTQKSKINSVDDKLYKTLSTDKIIKTNLDKYLKDKKSNETKEDLDYDEKLKALFDYVEKEDITPSKKCSYNNVNVGYLLVNLKTKLDSKEDEVYKTLSKNNKLKINLDEYLLGKEKNKDKKRLSFDENFDLLTKFIDKNDRLPTCTEKFKDVGTGNWYQHQKKLIDSENNEIYKKLSKNKIVKENLDKYLKDKKGNNKHLPFEKNFEILVDFIKENKKMPTCEEKQNNVSIGMWYKHQKRKINSHNDDLYASLSKDKTIKNSLDKYLSKKIDKV
jgi:hypothetical protein